MSDKKPQNPSVLRRRNHVLYALLVPAWGRRKLVTIARYAAKMIKSRKKRMGHHVTTSQAFAWGLSGIGILVTPPIRVQSLKRNQSVHAAWSRVGKRMNRALSKLADERKEAAG